MATQILPQALVFQEYKEVAASITEPLRAFIFGPDFHVEKYSADNKANIRVGAYSPTLGLIAGLPQRAAGDVADASFTKVFLENAQLKYYTDSLSLADTWTATSNLLTAVNTTLASGNGFTRTVAVPKDVEVGDKVKISVGSDVHETTVIGLTAETVASSHDANADAAANNDPATLVGNSSDTIVTSPIGCDVTVGTPNYAGYNGLASGNPLEIYVLEILNDGTLGTDTITAKVTAQYSNDSVAEITIPAGVLPLSGSFAVGTKGFTTTLTGINYKAGLKIQFNVQQTYTPIVNPITVTGTYTGAVDTTYIVEIVNGGTVASGLATFKVKTANGFDLGGPYTIPAAATPVAIGNYGLSVAFAAGSLSGGDQFSFDAVASKAGRYRKVQLADSVTNANILAAADLAVEFRAVRNVSVPALASATVANWTQDATSVSLVPGITAVLSGVGAVPVVAGDVYVEWRGYSQRNADAIKTISDVSELVSYFPGNTGVDSVLAYALTKALANCNGTAVKFIAVADGTEASWLSAIEKSRERADVYGFVPLTKDVAIQQLVSAHVNDLSSPEGGRWRVAWFSAEEKTTKLVVSATNGTINDDPSTAPLAYTKVVAAGAGFVTKGVRAGDEVRTNFAPAADGSETYDVYVVDRVINNDELVVLAGPAVAITIPQRIEISRTLTAQDRTDDLVLANAWASKRVRNVFPGVVEAAEGSVDSMFLAAAYAGLRSGVAPHQGLTNVAVQGFTGVSRTRSFYTRSQLDQLANAGYFIVTQSFTTGDIYARKQITTDVTSVDTVEDSVVATDDAIAYAYLNTIAAYIGKTNVTDSNLSAIATDLEATTDFLRNRGFTQKLGGLLVSATIKSLRRHSVYVDRLVVVMDVVRPAPLNNAELYLVYGF